jgi:hypothetical protein
MTINYNENRKDLQIDKLHEDLVVELEAKASALEIPVDYYITEFTNLSIQK